MKKALAIDIGGTKISNCIVKETGEIVSEVEKRSTPKLFSEIKNLLTEIVKKYENDVDIIAIATCGAVNNENTGIVGSTGNIAKEYPTLKFNELSKKTVFVENDANSAAWAEHIIGASRGYAHSVMLTLGTGVGGGIIVDNKILKGKNGAAGEMHFKMRTDRHRSCTCGSFDCFETYASGNGLKDTAREMLKDDTLSSYDVIDGVKKGDERFIRVFNQWQNDIKDGIIGLSNIFDPDCVVLSGSMAQFVDTDLVTKLVNSDIVTTPTKVVRGSAGNYSGMIGAALLAMGVK
ncbi:MAG: ROK family protein [Clostridiaceae bacterium]|jgi:glucokinase|nr:ROK family protein [Clostridiaceae bacterium]